MSSAKVIFNVDEVRRLRTKISQVSQDTNQLYLQLKGQASGWGGIPMNDHLVQAQVLINELTVEAEKLEDVIRAALKGVEGLQEENKQKANQLTQWFSLFAGMFGSFRTQTFAGRYTIPTAAQKAASNLITSFAALGGRDELDSDPAVEKLGNTIQTSRLGTVENIAAQSKLKDIFAARDQIAKAQCAYKIYEEFGNKAQMNAVHRQAEQARQKLVSLEVDENHYEAGKDLSVYFKHPAVQACEYDPSIITQNVPLLQNEEYLLLLRLAMEKTPAGENAKSQLETKRLEIEEAERQLALNAETGKKTYNFDEYTKTLWGNTWVLSKNGKTDREAAQASMAYNEAIKNGEIKPYQENVPVDYLTEQIIAAKNGTNYWTGEKISKLQAYGIIVSSLITTFQGIESFRGSLKRGLPLHPGANGIPASRVKQPKVSVPEVTVPKPVGKIAEGTGEVKPVQQINNRFPDDIQTGKEFSFNIENGYLKNTNGLTEVDFVVDMNGKLHIGRGHSFLANGDSVQAAGKLKLNGQGQVRSISNLSGHYTPSVEQAKLFSQVLEQTGVKTKNAWLEIYTIETTPSGYVNINELVKISSTQIK